jgi:hypothetical protein
MGAAAAGVAMMLSVRTEAIPSSINDTRNLCIVPSDIPATYADG